MKDSEFLSHIYAADRCYEQMRESRSKDRFVHSVQVGVFTELTERGVKGLQRLPRRQIVERGKRLATTLQKEKVQDGETVTATTNIGGGDPGITVPIGAYGERFSRALALAAAVSISFLGENASLEALCNQIEETRVTRETFFDPFRTLLVGQETLVATLGLIMYHKVNGHDNPFEVAAQAFDNDIVNDIARRISLGKIQPDAQMGRTNRYSPGLIDELGKIKMSPTLDEKLAFYLHSRRYSLGNNEGHGFPTQRAFGCPVGRRDPERISGKYGFSHNGMMQSAIELNGKELLHIAQLFYSYNII